MYLAGQRGGPLESVTEAKRMNVDEKARDSPWNRMDSPSYLLSLAASSSFFPHLDLSGPIRLMTITQSLPKDSFRDLPTFCRAHHGAWAHPVLAYGLASQATPGPRTIPYPVQIPHTSSRIGELRVDCQKPCDTDIKFRFSWK